MNHILSNSFPPEGGSHLIVLWGQFVQALLDYMIPVQILDQHYNMETESKDDGVDLSIVSDISLHTSPSEYL